MRAVVQRVTQASVTVEDETVGSVGPGIMVLIGVADGDTDKDLKYITDKVMNLRIFDDENGVMNRSVLDTGGSILAVSQFTLYGDARGGRRPSYIRAAGPEAANALYEQAVAAWRAQGIHVETGRFRTEMIFLFSVPSIAIIAWSTALWSVGSMPTIAFAISVRTFWTAVWTPFPPNLPSLSLSSWASHEPVEAPDGAIALTACPLIVISASTVGFPLESSTSLAHTFSIFISFPL